MTRATGIKGLLRSSCALLLLGGLARTVSAQDVGHEGQSYSGANDWPTGTKPQSKLWWNDGHWWGCLWDAAAQSFMIHRLVLPSHTWVDTGIAVDSRFRAHTDCLWDGTKLYIASHQFTNGLGTSGHPLLVYRYSYDPVGNSYFLDTGFPVQIGSTSTETLVIDKDSTGALWAVWVAGLRVWVSHTLGDDRSWSIPMIHPRCTTDLDSDDICSVIRFQGDKVGVMWSDNITDTYNFTHHLDGDPDTVWSAVELALSGPGIADDHINLKASADGRVFAILKAGNDENRLQVRSAGGAWVGHLVTSAVQGWTRAIVLLDEEDRNVHVFATSPILGGTVFRKTTSMDAISFGGGIGTAVIRDDADQMHNDATSTKQSVSGATGLVVLASHQPTQRYWHHYSDLGGSVPAAPIAAFSADPASGFEPLEVQFIDSSANAPTAWSWTFGDGGTSTAQHPEHVYLDEGVYTVSLQVTNGLGQDTLTEPGFVTVEAPPTELTLTALEDSHVREFSPNNNYGTETFLRIRDDVSSDYHAYLKFFVPSTGNQVSSALLRLFVNDPSSDGGAVHSVTNNWNESTISWASAPGISGLPLGGLGNVVLGTWAELDVSAFVTGSGTKSFGLQSLSTNSVLYSSRQGVNPPQLVLALEPPPPEPPIANFEVNKTQGTVPLTVQFADTSGGVVESWFWDFGDGATSTLQNPSHVYQQRGTFTVSLQATNEDGSDSETKLGLVHVTPPIKSWSGDVADGGGVKLPKGIPLTSELPRKRLEERVARLLPGFPLPDAATGNLERAGREVRLELALDGSLEDAVDFYEGRLSESGFTIRSRTVHRDAERVRGITLELARIGAYGSLELRRGAAQGVEATIFLTTSR